MSKKIKKKDSNKIDSTNEREAVLKLSDLSDEDLIKRIISKNSEQIALKTLIRRYQKKVIGIIFPYVKDEEIAKDIFQETLLRALVALDQEKYEEKGNFGAWLIQIAKNLATDYVRKQKKYRVITIGEQSLLDILITKGKKQKFSKKEKEIEDLPVEYVQHSYDQSKDFYETIIKLREAIKELPKPQREAIVLRFYHDKKYKEIAEITGVSINTALARVRYGLIHLKKILQKNNLNES